MQRAVRPFGPTDEAINSDRQAGVQRRSRSTPAAERVTGGEGLIHSNRRTCPGEKDLTLQPLYEAEDEGLVHSVDSASAACEGLRHSASAASLLGDLTSSPGFEGTAPRFLGRETLEKPETASNVTARIPPSKPLA